MIPALLRLFNEPVNVAKHAFTACVNLSQDPDQVRWGPRHGPHLPKLCGTLIEPQIDQRTRIVPAHACSV